MSRLENMIKVVDSNMKKQLGIVDRKLKRISQLEIEVTDLKANGITSRGPVSRAGSFTGDQAADFEICLNSVTDLQQRMLTLENDWTGLDALKLKHDVSELVSEAQKGLSSSDMLKLLEDVKSFRTSIATINFEI